MGFINCLSEVLRSIIMSFEGTATTSKEEYDNEKEVLRKAWENEYRYYSDDMIQNELKRYGYYNWNIKYDGRRVCVEKLIEYNVNHNYKVI